jgi:hypothetical protein
MFSLNLVSLAHFTEFYVLKGAMFFSCVLQMRQILTKVIRVTLFNFNFNFDKSKTRLKK